MSIQIDAVKKDIIELGAWIETVLPTNRWEAVRSRCSEARKCPTYFYVGRTGLNALQTVYGKPVGTEAASDELRINLVLHQAGCDGLEIAQVERESQTASRPDAPTTAACTTKRRLRVGRSSSSLPIIIADERSVEELVEVRKPSGRLVYDNRPQGFPHSYERGDYPDEVAEVRLILDAMRDEITAHLSQPIA